MTSSNARQRRLEEALRLWLRWNEAHERLTERLFAARHDQQRLEDLADEVDRLRQAAVAATHEALNDP